ncbi:hypothetical protein GGF46_004377 [Coemansia sp. RSA 552]|nr:hypothetical protein GGF46_004377 [Coemansia sp. RSA 552]
MSRFLHITSLLNAGDGEQVSHGTQVSQGTQETQGASGDAYLPKKPPSPAPRHSASMQTLVSRNSEPRQHPPPQPLPPLAAVAGGLGGAVAGGLGGAVASGTHAVRSHPMNTMHDYRFWPYVRHAMPPQAAPAQPPPMPCGPYGQPYLPQMPVNAYFDPRRGYTPWHRQRRTRACQNCHVKKVKCEGDGGQCFNCIRSNTECKWIPMKKRGPKPKPRLEDEEAELADALNINTAATMTPAVDVYGKPLAPTSTALRGALGLGPSSRPLSIKSRNTSATTIVTSPLASVSTPSLVRVPEDSTATSSSSLRPPSPAEQGFSKLVKESQAGDMDQRTTEDTLRRFYSEEVSEETRNTVVYYFEYFYTICPVYHPASFLRRVVDGKVDPILLDAMKASAARLINRHTNCVVDLDKLIDETNSKLLLYLKEPNIDYVRAVLVMASLNGGECRFITYNSLTCLATSLVTRLGWHMLDAHPPATKIDWPEWRDMEIKRRTFYVVYIIEGYLGMLSDRSMSITDTRLMVRAPGSDESWDSITTARVRGKFPARFDELRSNRDIIQSGSLAHSMVSMVSLTTIISRVNSFLWDIKLKLSTYANGNDYRPNLKYFKPISSDIPHVPLPIRSLFDIGSFREVHDMLTQWMRGLIDASDMKHLAQSDHLFSKFGDYSHRMYLARVRYFCLYTYSLPVIHCLHFANRPSYFVSQTAKKIFAETPDVSSLTEAPENRIIYEILGNVFTERLNSGMLAYDIVDDSWRECVEIVYEFIRHLDRNDDIPAERYDQAMPLCLMSSMTVLIRNVRKCKHKINNAADKGAPEIEDTQNEISRSTTALRRLWTLLGELTSIWRVDGVEQLLRIMQVEEVINAADLLSGLSL